MISILAVIIQLRRHYPMNSRRNAVYLSDSLYEGDFINTHKYKKGIQGNS